MSILASLLPQDCLLCGGTSPKPLCRACAASLPEQPEPACPVCGEGSPAGCVCGECLRSPPYFDATIAAFRYAFPVDKLIQSLKYRQHLALASILADAMARRQCPAGDLMLPVPLSAQRLRQRGFNQALEIGRPLARMRGLPLLVEQCSRARDTVPQATLPWKERHSNIRHAFECAADLAGKTVIVVDDVMTTGATLNELARCLKGCGAGRVVNWVVARASRDNH